VALGSPLHDDAVAKALLDLAKDYAIANCRAVHPSQAKNSFDPPSIFVYIVDGAPPERIQDATRVQRVTGRFRVFQDKVVLEEYKNAAAEDFAKKQGRLAAQAARRQIIQPVEDRAAASARFSFKPENNFCTMDPSFTIIVDVPPPIDLSDDKLAKAYAEEAYAQAWANCESLSFRPFWTVSVSILQGSAKTQQAWAEWRNTGFGITHNYRNLVLERRKAEQETQRVAQQKEAALRPVRERLKAFLERHKVTNLVACESLSRNPYALEGKIVALYGAFESMLARDRGVFATSGPCPFVVSSIPSGVFGTDRSEVLLAGGVLGQAEVKLPLFGTIQAPNLRFVGVHVCRARACADIIPRE
jgi:hypothetical protein